MPSVGGDGRALASGGGCAMFVFGVGVQRADDTVL